MRVMIPKIIHQMWFGVKPMPIKLMNTWKEKHPDYEYILWTEEEVKRRGMVFKCQKKIDSMMDFVGTIDIMRWEILEKYGGIYIDADSICLHPLDEYFNNKVAFATYENENIRKDLVATGTMGFPPHYQLCKDIIEWIHSDAADESMKKLRAWASVGPGLLTKYLETGKYKDFFIYPSHCFLPAHFTGLLYKGHKKVYAYQYWGNTNNIYNIIDTLEVPKVVLEPKFWVSVLIPSYNTSIHYIKECLESIMNQECHIGIEIVWVNDGSTPESSAQLEKELEKFRRRTRFCKVVYHKLEKHMGVAYAQNEGVKICSNELIFRMDSDDIMMPDRIAKQIDFMRKNKDCVVCGGNIFMFTSDNNNEKTMLRRTEHPLTLSWDDFMKYRPSWFMNQPTLCMRKSAVLSVGNYNVERGIQIGEDYELELKLMHKYGKIHNIPDILLLYRIHKDQLTFQHDSDSTQMKKLQEDIIKDIIMIIER